MTGRFSSLTFGTVEPKDVVYSALRARRTGATWREGDSDYRGGAYYESPGELGGDPYAEHWYVQDNADMGDLAEEEWPEVPTLVYIEATTAPEERVRELDGVVGLRLMRREDWNDPRDKTG